MSFPRSSGILLHPTSLPGPFGIGDLGPAAFAFADFLHTSGQSIWQMLPLGPTGYGDSPYQCFSAFAGNPVLISLEKLRDDGLLSAKELEGAPSFSQDEVEYERVNEFKQAKLRQAFRNFRNQETAPLEIAAWTYPGTVETQHAAASPLPHGSSTNSITSQHFEAFKEAEKSWLPEYALFRALKDKFGGIAWPKWDRALASREPNALRAAREELAEQIAEQEFLQFVFFSQWEELKRYCAAKNIRVMGDLPIYVAHDSADVWTHPQYFHIDERGNATKVAGVPPDYFSATGQLWGNPIYRWDRMAANGYEWWIHRFRAAFRMFDMLRVDHFRGFQAYWEVPGGDTTAQNGTWQPGPGAALFAAVESALGPLPIVAENLGVITAEVEAIRERFGLPGMAILQFAFGNDPQGPSFRPHNYPRNLVAYTGTHDNDTVVGWWTSKPGQGSIRSAEDIRKEREFTRAYLNLQDQEINWVFIRALMASVADTVVFPLQDILGAGEEARMNVPGTATGNWKWRLRDALLGDDAANRLREMAEVYERLR